MTSNNSRRCCVLSRPVDPRPTIWNVQVRQSPTPPAPATSPPAQQVQPELRPARNDRGGEQPSEHVSDQSRTPQPGNPRSRPNGYSPPSRAETTRERYRAPGESRRSLPHNPVKQSFHNVRSSLHTRPSRSTTNHSKAEEPGGTPRPAPPTPNPRNALFLLISVSAAVPSSSAANGSAPSSSNRGTT